MSHCHSDGSRTRRARAALRVLFAAALSTVLVGAGADPLVIPADIPAGGKYRLTFVTSTATPFVSGDINFYNDFVTDVALTQPTLAALNTTWRVIGSTETVDARDNTNTNPLLSSGKPIYLLDSVTRIANNNLDLWDGSIDAFIDRYETGDLSAETVVVTGTKIDGTAAHSEPPLPFESYAIGALAAAGGINYISSNFPPPQPDGWWIFGCCIYSVYLPPVINQIPGDTRMYALSGELTVPRPGGPFGQVATIALGGDAAPDGNGVLHRFEGQAVVNDDSAVLFVGDYAVAGGDFHDVAVLVDDGVATQLAREGEAAPDGNGSYGDFSKPALGNDGTAGLYSTFRETSGGFTDDKGVILIDGGASVAVREGGSANGDGTYVSINANLEPTLALNNLGQVALVTALTGNAGGFAKDGTIVVGDGVTQNEIAREGDPTPPPPPLSNGNYGAFSAPVMNDVGTVVFRAHNFTNLNPPFIGASAVISQTNGIATEIVRADTNSPDGNGKFNSLSDALALNNNGQVAFSSTMKNTLGGFFVDGVAMFRGEPAALHVLARAGDAAPDGNGVIEAGFATFGPPRINDFGEVAFNTQYSGTLDSIFDDNAILKGNVIGAQSSLIEVVREGWSLPGEDGVFADLSQAIDMNAAGVVAFTASLRNLAGNPPPDQEGIFLGDGIDIVEVVRTADVLNGYTVDPQGLRAFGFGITEGSLNTHGQVVFHAKVRKPGTLTEGVYLFTPDLYWRGGLNGDWDEPLIQLGATNPDALQNWTLSLIPDRVHNVVIDRTHGSLSGNAVPSISIVGPNTDVTLKHLSLGEETDLRLTGAHLNAIDGVLLDGGRLHGAGELSGDVTINPGGILEADGLTVNGDIVNEGRIEVTRLLNDFGIFNGTITNLGDTVIANASLDPASATFNGNFINQGSLQVGANQTADFFGDYFGAGSIANDGSLTFHGGFFPGASPAYLGIEGAGTLAIAATAMTVIELGGTLRGEFHGDPLAQYDSINLIDGGQLVLGGTLQVTLIGADDIAPPFMPALGDSFVILLAGEILGDFDGPLVLPELASGLAWLVDRDSQQFELLVVDANAVPLPAGVWLLGAAVVVLWRQGSRRPS